MYNRVQQIIIIMNVEHIHMKSNMYLDTGTWQSWVKKYSEH